MEIESIVPQGIEIFGFFKSPLIATPAVNPVTAGKNIPNRVAKLGDSIMSDPILRPSEDPINIEDIDNTINPKMTY